MTPAEARAIVGRHVKSPGHPDHAEFVCLECWQPWRDEGCDATRLATAYLASVAVVEALESDVYKLWTHARRNGFATTSIWVDRAEVLRLISAALVEAAGEVEG